MTPLPADLPPTMHAVFASAPAAAPAGPPLLMAERWSDYEVQEHDTLFDLAAEHGTTVAALVERNDLERGGAWIMPGQRLSLPAGNAGSEEHRGRTADQDDADSHRTRARTVTVRPGDTLWHLARRHDVSVATLVRVNDLAGAAYIFPGQQLALSRSESTSSSPSSSRVAQPEKSRATQVAAGPRAVTIRPGDTLAGIAEAQGISLTRLSRANTDLDAQRLWVGQQVTIPATSDASSNAAGGDVVPYTSSTIGDVKADEDVEDTFLHYTYDEKVARSAAANREYLAEAPAPDRERTRAMVVQTARRHGVDPALMLALSSMESGWNQRAVSPANAIGVMQVIPSSGEWASGLVGQELNLLDPQDNITAGTAIVRALLRAADSEDEAIGGYYQGLGSVNEHGLFSDTEHYVTSIQQLRTNL